MLNSIRDTTKHVYWNSREHCYVALMAEVPTCRAEGATPAEALQNVDKAYARDDYTYVPPINVPALPRSSGYMAVR